LLVGLVARDRVELSAVDQPRAIGALAPALLDDAIASLDDGTPGPQSTLPASPAGCSTSPRG
jgi:hypothetical protein